MQAELSPTRQEFIDGLTMTSEQVAAALKISRDTFDRKLLMLNIDAGGVQSRRLLDQWMEKESAPAPAGGAA